ncbi:MAG: SEC-C metal-binding domain-containing protein [Candidatus Methanoperedens sp.]|nr:SEC-C metal-binding domain-containing protein [Candidatus Methanoperedens sp.]
MVSDDSPEDILATINYGWESPKFYKKWMGAAADSDMIKMMTRPILEISCRQTEYANHFLELFEEVIKDKDYVDRLARHYFLFKGSVNEAKGGMGGKKIGRNEPCPCGSGKKYKKCCGV